MPSEKRKELTKQIVIRLKEVIKDMSDAEVMQKMAEAGEQTSIATIRRIRAAGSEDSGFNYNLTVKPFARVFLELNSKPVDIEALDSDAEKDRATLDNTIQMKNLEIDGLQTELATSRRSIGFLLGQVAFKERQMERKDIQIAAKDKQLEERAGYLMDKDEQISGLKKDLATQKKISRRLFSVWCLTLLALIAALVSDSILRLL